MTDVGTVFIGIGGMVFCFGITYMVYQVTRQLKQQSDKEARYQLFEEMVITEAASKKGFDLEKEMLKRKFTPKKSFRKEIEREVIESMFPEKKEK